MLGPRFGTIARTRANSWGEEGDALLGVLQFDFEVMDLGTEAAVLGAESVEVVRHTL